MIRKSFDRGGQVLSYLDNERAGPVLVGLHGHFGCASMLSFLGGVHPGRLILIDQRGHGFSGHATSYERQDYLDDLDAVLAREGVVKPVILGHSLGGVNAYQYAARTGNAQALVVEDIGTTMDLSNAWVLGLPPTFPTVRDAALALEAVGVPPEPYFFESLVYDGTAWRFRFDGPGMVESQRRMNGDHWADWQKVGCPVLLVHGTKSWAAETSNLRQMVAQVPGAELVEFVGAGHTLHDERRPEFLAALEPFLARFRETPVPLP
jgi:pimeloyl-ACP methyl ester carboxylesterase